MSTVYSVRLDEELGDWVHDEALLQGIPIGTFLKALIKRAYLYSEFEDGLPEIIQKIMHNHRVLMRYINIRQYRIKRKYLEGDGYDFSLMTQVAKDTDDGTVAYFCIDIVYKQRGDFVTIIKYP